MSRPHLLVEADGGSRGNPGPAGYGAVVRDAKTGTVLAERSASLGLATNNVAEYSGLIAGLVAAAELNPASVEVKLDSKLVVEQMCGRWKVKNPQLQKLASTALALVRELGSVRFTWIPRELNVHADRLANEAMDAAEAETTGLSSLDSRAGSIGENRVASTKSGLSEQATESTPTGYWRRSSTPATRMLLARHAETTYFAERLVCGRDDPPLTARGQAQAEALAGRLRHHSVSAVISSPLKRAVDTAEAIAAAHGLPIVIDKGFVECDLGEWDGLPMSEISHRWPAEWEGWLADPHSSPPGGETLLEVTNRVVAAHSKLVSDHPAQTIVVVSHVVPIKVIIEHALGCNSISRRLHLDVASLSIVDFYRDSDSLLSLFNDTGHLRHNS